MTTKPFSSTLNDYIVSILKVRALGGSTDWELASRIWGAIENTDVFKNEGHDFDAILAQVKNLRAAHMGPGASAAGNASAFRRNNTYSATTSGSSTSTPTPTPTPTSTSGSGGGPGSGSSSWSWRNAWSNFTNTAGASARAWGSSARSAWSGSPGAAAGGAGAGSGSGRGGRGWGPWGGWWGRGGTGAGGSGRGQGRGRGGRWWTGGNPGAGRRTSQTTRTGHSGFSGFKRAWASHRIDPWIFQQFQPSSHGFYGKSGAAAGYTMGTIAGGTVGGIVGQTVGTIIGNFVEKMKDAALYAREFAVALKETNRRFINYDSSIAASYVESDFADMRRNFIMARAIAPNVISMNRNLTTYQNTILPWDILRQTMNYEGKNAGLGAAQAFAEIARPTVQALNYVREYLSPDGNLGYKMAYGATAIAIRHTMASVYSSIPFFGPMINLAGNMLANFLPKPNAGVNGDPAGPWERLIDNPNNVPPRDAQFNQKPMIPIGGIGQRGRF